MGSEKIVEAKQILDSKGRKNRHSEGLGREAKTESQRLLERCAMVGEVPMGFNIH